MTTHKQFARGTVLALMLGLLTAVFSQPASAASTNADLRELQRYTLTMTDLRKYAAASAALAKHPKAQKDEEEDSDDDDDDDSGAESLDDMVKRIDSMPEARKAIEGAGLSTRQFAVITMALLQASFAQFAIKAGADPAKVARDAGVNPANIEFVKKNKAEIEKLNPRKSG